MGKGPYNCWGGADVPDENDRQPSRGMHAARPDSSDRLRRVLDVLRGHPHGVSSINLQEQAATVAPGTCISELRRSGYVISCDYSHKTSSGAKVYVYRLLASRKDGDGFEVHEQDRTP